MGPAHVLLRDSLRLTLLPIFYVAAAEYFHKVATTVAILISEGHHAQRIFSEQEWALATFGASYLGWLVARRVFRLAPATSAGFHVAGYALVSRSLCELALAIRGGPDLEDIGGELGPVVRGMCLAAVVAGIAAVVAACWAELRWRRAAREELLGS